MYIWTFSSCSSPLSPLDATLPQHANSPSHGDPPRESPTGDHSSSWSAQIASRYQCHLPDDLVDWFDSRIWEKTGQSEYCDPVDPRTLLDAAPEVIWPGLMPCDFLPLIGSRAGDWLGVRFDRTNHACEIIQWYHGGGDWIPWGKTISEAIVFGAVGCRLPGPRRRHAIPAEDFQQTVSVSFATDRLLQWASDHVDIEHDHLIDPNFKGLELADTLLRENIAEVAVRCYLVQAALHETLSDVLNHRTAQAIDVQWHTAVSWMFDIDQIPHSARRRLENRCGYKHDNQQDWTQAQEHAEAITKSHPEIAWGWDLLGYCHEKINRIDDAVKAYSQGMGKTVFSDQSVKLRTYWETKNAAKFSAARLLTLRPTITHGGDSDYLLALTSGNQEQRRIAVTNYWLSAADRSSEQAETMRALMSAGWDLGAEPIPAFAGILERIAQADETQTARTTLAATHRECLKHRYGI